ncbi:MAG: 4Fe-4S binding protein [Dehalococcoidia bacterium]
MSKSLRLNKGAEEGVRDLLKFLLESGKVKGVFTLASTGENCALAYMLMTNAEALEEAYPLHPLMPTNAAKVLSRLTLMEAANEPVAAVVRPCELRALTELMKLSQGSLENLVLISSNCGGVYPLEMGVNGDVGEKLPDYWDAVRKGELASGIRPACMACQHFVPYNADMTVDVLGNSEADKQCDIVLNTERGEQLAVDMPGELVGQEPDAAAMERVRNMREEQKSKVLEEIWPEGSNVEQFFGRCIGCQTCSKVCPICYCHVCFFDSKTGETPQSHYLSEIDLKGYTRIAPDPAFYQLVRLFHVSASCVGCGLCADVCPVNIPVWAASAKTAGAVQEAFGYVPGRDVDEGLPAISFTPEEFSMV